MHAASHTKLHLKLTAPNRAQSLAADVRAGPDDTDYPSGANPAGDPSLEEHSTVSGPFDCARRDTVSTKR